MFKLHLKLFCGVLGLELYIRSFEPRNSWTGYLYNLDPESAGKEVLQSRKYARGAIVRNTFACVAKKLE